MSLSLAHTAKIHKLNIFLCAQKHTWLMPKIKIIDKELILDLYQIFNPCFSMRYSSSQFKTTVTIVLQNSNSV